MNSYMLRVGLVTHIFHKMDEKSKEFQRLQLNVRRSLQKKIRLNFLIKLFGKYMHSSI